jgi:hypothetical protein
MRNFLFPNWNILKFVMQINDPMRILLSKYASILKVNGKANLGELFHTLSID